MQGNRLKEFVKLLNMRVFHEVKNSHIALIYSAIASIERISKSNSGFLVSLPQNFSTMCTHMLSKFCGKICAKMANFIKQSEFRKRSIFVLIGYKVIGKFLGS